MKKHLKRIFWDNKKYWMVVFLSFILFGLCTLFLKNNTVTDNYISRPGVDEYDAEMEIEVEGLLDKPQRMEIPVSKRLYSESEAKEAIKAALEKALKILPGKNNSLQNITENLNPINEISELGISIRWDFGDTELIDISGNVYNENLSENTDLDIEATLIYESYEESYIIPVRICPKTLSEEERILK